MKSLLLLAISFLIASSLKAQSDIVPRPAEVKKLPGGFQLDSKTAILGNTDQANMLNFYLEKLYGFTLPIKQTVNKSEKESILIQ